MASNNGAKLEPPPPDANMNEERKMEIEKQPEAILGGSMCEQEQPMDGDNKLEDNELGNTDATKDEDKSDSTFDKDCEKDIEDTGRFRAAIYYIPKYCGSELVLIPQLSSTDCLVAMHKVSQSNCLLVFLYFERASSLELFTSKMDKITRSGKQNDISSENVCFHGDMNAKIAKFDTSTSISPFKIKPGRELTNRISSHSEFDG